jgi:hypothetical protein
MKFNLWEEKRSAGACRTDVDFVAATELASSGVLHIPKVQHVIVDYYSKSKYDIP